MNVAFIKSYKCLDNIFRKGAYSSIELNETLLDSAEKDRPLITKIVYGVLDKNITLEYEIKLYAQKIKPAVLPILKIGLYALRYLSIPQFAVINECVELTKNIGKKELSGFTNAILRNLSQKKEFPLPENIDEKLSVKYSFPLWAVKKLIAEKGEEFTQNFLAYEPPRLTHIRINLNAVSVKDFCELLDNQKINYKKSIFDDALFVEGMPKINKKFFTPMSVGSMAVVKALDAQGECDVLDVCAAPGGKSVFMAQSDKSATVTACDIYPHRVELIKSYAKRMGVKNIEAVICDSAEFNPDFENKFDYVLCDAPCSGMGVFYDKPDIKFFRQEKDIAELSALQKKILLNAAAYVKKGGFLVYSTCTIFDEENAQNADFLLKHNHEFEFLSYNLPKFGQINGEKQFFPHIDGVEGYYIAKFTKK
ncbi:MAG TPA: 16S rRNA (cytosine(967)-C(5))-methyltransferase RsmB [Clostridia bacterium]|nr:16S rRNA (cytosine(967)-C(5))-methyltransferase RsmB [Clostridia bacterium]